MKTSSIDQTVDLTLGKYENYVNKSMARLYRFMGLTTLEEEAYGSVVRDIHGKEYIDCSGYGVFFHGHSHPKIVARVKEQAGKLAQTTRLFPHKPIADLAEAIARVTPGDLQYTFFCNSGTEAVEGALKLARAYTGKPKVIAAYGAFHGKTLGSLSVSGRELYRKPFYPLLAEIVHVPFGDADAVLAATDDQTAAIILEPIQGEGGVILPPAGYLKRVREICDEKGVLLILDEVQTGIGRTGKMFACEHYGIAPDIITMAKSLGGGVVPIGAFTATPEVFSVFDENPYLHSSTFGGNPLACTAGLAALEVIEEERLLERASKLGKKLLTALREIAARHPRVISEVRGKGLLIGLDLVKEGAGGMLIAELLDRRILALHSLNNPRVIRVMPPAVMTYEQADRVISSFAEAAASIDSVIDEL